MKHYLLPALIMGLSISAWAATAPTSMPTSTTGNEKTIPVSTAETQKIQQVVKEYLVKNPEVVVESLQAYEQKQMEVAHESMLKTQQIAPKFSENLFKQSNDPVIGNPNGAVTLVEFFDYQCPHCVDMTPVIEMATKSNPSLRVVLKEFPIRGPLSEFAAKATLAAKNQGKYFELHQAIMSSKERLTEESILKAATTLGLKIDQLKTDMNSAAVEQALKANTQLAKDLGLLGTPAFFIAKSSVTAKSAPDAIVFIPGQIDQTQLQALIEKIEKS